MQKLQIKIEIIKNISFQLRTCTIKTIMIDNQITCSSWKTPHRTVGVEVFHRRKNKTIFKLVLYYKRLRISPNLTDITEDNFVIFSTSIQEKQMKRRQLNGSPKRTY